MTPQFGMTFQLGDLVRKKKGSQWTGHVVGFYGTELNPDGYCVESRTEKDSAQIYPAAALELVPAQAQPVTRDALTAAVDAAMVEMANIAPPLRRSDCQRLIRAALAVPAQPVASGEPMTTDEAREYLVTFMEQHFTDKTFHRYIRGQIAGSGPLAGDFAWQMATALRALAATQPAAASAKQPITKEWCERMADLEIDANCNIEAGAPVAAQGEREAIPTWQERCDQGKECSISKAKEDEIADLRAALAAKVQPVAVPDVDWLANVIRSVDGNHKMGAGALAEKIVQALAAPSPQPAIQAGEWQPIEFAPKDGRTILLGRFNECGKWRTMRGQWFSAAQIADEWEEPDDAEEGWYETAVEPDVPNCWAIFPTHWMPLPVALQQADGGGA